ncbi:Oidioi.mRNA.OKI2018_I69.PAR.g9709.t1.cds [Oikopleura dioica]|uniref:Oidioi.mRNA.OKI2018_I69.PAR.g9709.t1.cds n=1 Tax=Oikopleura dioica TaxID=34765 RepID=A0ABN7RM36_OIKDI|nr:Oidioi.mRNA.OKI2018_I69.PAR.g9709.t1.cds [Oikopleura dioica]
MSWKYEIVDENETRKELDIESLIKQRDQIVATFIRQSWAQEIIKKTLKVNNNPNPKETKPKPVTSLIQTSTITLVKFTDEQQAQLLQMQVANHAVEPMIVKKEKIDDDDDHDKPIPDQKVPISSVKQESELIVKTEQEFFDN